MSIHPQQGEGNPPVPGSGSGHKRELNPELIEHRVNEIAESVKEIAQETKAIKESVIRIETRLESMASSKELADVNTGIERVKVWVLTGALAGVGTGIGVGIGATYLIVRLLGGSGQ